TDANRGTVVGIGGTILRTTDGGDTWVNQASGTDNWLETVCFTDRNTGTAVGIGGTILRATTGGN
ncbi:MAG: glycosyl hydrolase, partial [candidate division Zixibacteria bacterium]|nr:glycosyl hydrolase [candidate division Zixibacteria bacterium]